MATIIEREIERREKLILEKAEKEERVAKLKEEIRWLESEIESTDEEVLWAEIDELKAYLPKPEAEPDADAVEPAAPSI